jgi:hypothetical protein
VDVVGHHDEVAEAVTLAVKMMERRRHGLGNGPLAKGASAEAAIEILHELPRELAIELPLQVRLGGKLSFPIAAL